MQLFVQGQQLYTLNVEGTETVQDVKALVQERENVAAEELAVFCEGKPLENDACLSDLNNLASVRVEVRMLGGKVHGSLARAGKVRGQTPKVGWRGLKDEGNGV